MAKQGPPSPMTLHEPTDAMIEAARDAICKRQRSLVAKITKSSIRDALVAANEARGEQHG